MTVPSALCRESADFLRARMPFVPEVAVVLGSCLGPFAHRLEDPVSVDYGEIPHFPVSTVASHAGKLLFGTLGDRRVACLSGRFHSYEGYPFPLLALPVRALRLLGVRALVLTNAAGAVNPAYCPGDVMVLSDHIQCNGSSSLRGPNPDGLGPRFPDTSRLYDPALRALALARADGAALRVHEGVYAFFPGPQFETPAEIRAARVLGADAVGMSTVPEALAAGHCGLPLLALSVLTNMAAGVLDRPLSGDEVDETARRIAGPLGDYLQALLQAL